MDPVCECTELEGETFFITIDISLIHKASELLSRSVAR